MKIYHEMGRPRYYDDGPDRRALLDHPYRFGQVDYRRHLYVGQRMKMLVACAPLMRMARAISAPLTQWAKEQSERFNSPEFKAQMKRIQAQFKSLKTMMDDSPKQKAYERSRRDMQAKRRAARRSDIHKPRGIGR
jgi:hypothetical protein